MDLYKTYVTKRRKILHYFGLPDTPDFSAILDFGKHQLTENEVQETIEKLQNAAGKFHPAPLLKDEQILKAALEQKKSPYRVLPELGFDISTYTIFVYNEILLKNLDTIENILSALQRASRIDIRSRTENIASGENFTLSDSIQELKRAGIPYLVEYQQYIKRNGNNPVHKLLHAFSPEYSIDNFDEKFDEIACYLTNYTALNVNLKPYRITELEIYYYHPVLHPDPYVHKHPLQLTNAQWYFHGSGLDITFGSYDSIYAGVLIRGIKDLEQNRYIDGPLNVIAEIFKRVGDIETGRYFFNIIPYISKDKDKKPIKSLRILKKKEEDKDNFNEKLYRYLAEINPDHKFREKSIVAKQLLKSGRFSKEEINSRFGYKIV